MPFAAGEYVHCPVPELHAPGAVWHASGAVPHEPGFVPLQMPARQLYVRHLLEPLQARPSAAFGFEQSPVAGLHVPATWQPSLAEHVTLVTPVQAPFWQLQVLHLSAPVQGVPFVFDVAGEQVPVAGLHAPGSWHWSGAVHVTGFDPVQLPPVHA